MGIHANRFYALLLLFSSSCTSLAQNNELETCQRKIKDISGTLGCLLIVETIFCCYVLFTWYKNSRIRRKERNSTNPEQGEGQFPMYTDIDEDNARDQNQKRPKNGRCFGLFLPTGVARQPGHQIQSAVEKNTGQRFSEGVIPRRNTKPKMVDNPETTASSSNKQMVEANDVGGLVYSEPYEDKVTAASELMSKNPEMHFGKIGKEPPPEEENQVVYYHVLEESAECAANAPTPPIKPLLFTSNSNTREVYYYCDSSHPDDKTAPSTPLPLASSKEPEEDDLYYSCVAEESASIPSKANPNKAFLPLNRNFKESSLKATASGLAAAQQKPCFYIREIHPQSQKREQANKKARMLRNNPMMNAHMIEEMKNRVANKKSGN